MKRCAAKGCTKKFEQYRPGHRYCSKRCQQREHHARWRVAHRQHFNRYSRKWKRQNPEKVRATGERYYLRVRSSGTYRLKQHQAELRRHGLTVEDYWAIWCEQDGLCAICWLEEAHQLLSVDHDHATNQRRGLLCGRCNRALGMMKDDPARLRRAADYLEGSQRADLRQVG